MTSYLSPPHLPEERNKESMLWTFSCHRRSYFERNYCKTGISTEVSKKVDYLGTRQREECDVTLGLGPVPQVITSYLFATKRRGFYSVPVKFRFLIHISRNIIGAVDRSGMVYNPRVRKQLQQQLFSLLFFTKKYYLPLPPKPSTYVKLKNMRVTFNHYN